MNSKLTLSLDARAIARGKEYAASRGQSLSHVVETYLLLLDAGERPAGQVEVTRRLQSLVGIGAGPCDERDWRAHLEERHV